MFDRHCISFSFYISLLLHDHGHRIDRRKVALVAVLSMYLDVAMDVAAWWRKKAASFRDSRGGDNIERYFGDQRRLSIVVEQ